MTTLRNVDEHLVGGALALAACLCACMLLAQALRSYIALPYIFYLEPQPAAIVCFLALSLSLIAIRRASLGIAAGLILFVPLLTGAAVLAVFLWDSTITPLTPAFPVWYAPPRPAYAIVLLPLSLAILLSLPRRPLQSRSAVLLASIVTSTGLATIFGLPLANGSVLLSPIGGVLSTLIGAATIGTNYKSSWHYMLLAGKIEAPASRLIFISGLLGPVALGVLGLRLGARPDILSIFDMSLYILLSILILSWVSSRIGRAMATQRAISRAFSVAPIAITDANGRILYWSTGCETLYGWSAANAKGQYKQILLGHGQQEDRPLAPPQGVDNQEVERIERRRDGRIIHVREQAHLLGTDAKGQALVALVMTDVTDRHTAQVRQAELRDEMLHASRLSDIGEAAAGLAHELRQPLAAAANFIGIAELMVDKPDPDEERLKGTLSLAWEQARRASDIVQRFQAFLTKRPDQIQPEPIVDTVRGAIDLSMTGLDAQRTVIDYRHDSRHDFMMADRVQIQQVLVNLIRNAIEAQAAAHIDAPTVRLSAEDMDGEMIRISVRDHGPGIVDMVLRASYRPFTSTKEDGMGLGLSICRRIVESHGGTIHAENDPDGGALLWFTIPAAEQPLAMS